MSEETHYRDWLVEHLRKSRDRIIESWKRAVAADDEIPTADKLTMSALEDHFPEMLDELIETIHEGEKGTLEKRSQKTGREHGKSRWRQGYRLDEVIRELNRIRELLVDAVVSFTRDHFPAHTGESEIQLIRRFFDTVVATSAQQFATSQEAEVILRTNQLRNAYEQAQAATEELRLVSESRLRLLRAVVHELRNVLQPIGLSALALLEEPRPMDRQVIGKELTKIGGRLQALLDRLLQYSEILAGEARVRAETFALSELLHYLEEAHRLDAEQKSVAFECRNDETGFDTINSDREKLLQIGTSLIDNAITHTDTGSIKVDCVAAEDGGRWILRVTDTGCGISPEEAQQVFEGFHAPDDTHSGLHLGLLIARHLAHLLEGEITFQSEVGRGSCFEVNLPRYLDKSAAPPLRLTS